MSEAIVRFSFEGHQVRTALDAQGEPMWIAKDVCAALGLVDSRVALRALDADEKGECSTPTPGGVQKLATVTLPGLLRLIGASRKETAKRFQRWNYHEVLPSIYKHGGYCEAGREQEFLAAMQEKDATIALLQSKVLMLEEHGSRLARLEDAIILLVNKNVELTNKTCNIERQVHRNSAPQIGKEQSRELAASRKELCELRIMVGHPATKPIEIENEIRTRIGFPKSEGGLGSWAFCPAVLANEARRVMSSMKETMLKQLAKKEQTVEMSKQLSIFDKN